ncbi:MAG: peptidylprolyl isomerase [Acidobacteriota bacterium]
MIKPVATIIVALLLGVGLLLAQSRATSVSNVNITKEDIESWVSTMPPQQLRMLTSQPEAKKQLVDQLKEIFSLSLEAERVGINSRPDVQTELGLMEKFVVAQTFRERKQAEQPKAIEVKKEDVDEFYKNNPGSFDKFLAANPRFKTVPPEQLEGLKSQYAELEILVERANRMKIGEEKGVQMMWKVQRASYLARRMAQELQQTTQVNDEELKGYYTEHPQQFEESRLRHILIMFPETREQRAGAQEGEKPKANKPATKEEARKKADELLKQIKSGANFEQLAKDNSDDGSAQAGGDLGFVRSDVRYVPEFKDAAFKLKPGQVSEVVETQFGYHIIRMDEKRVAPFDEAVKTEIKERKLEEKVQKRIDELKGKNLVTIDENFTLPTPPPAPTPPPGAPIPQGAGAAPSDGVHGSGDGHGHAEEEN